MPDTSYELSPHIGMCLILQMSQLRLERVNTLSRIYQDMSGRVSFQTDDSAPAFTSPATAGYCDF